MRTDHRNGSSETSGQVTITISSDTMERFRSFGREGDSDDAILQEMMVQLENYRFMEAQSIKMKLRTSGRKKDIS